MLKQIFFLNVPWIDFLNAFFQRRKLQVSTFLCFTKQVEAFVSGRPACLLAGFFCSFLSETRNKQ